MNGHVAHHSHPLILQLGLHLSSVISCSGLVVRDTSQPVVQIVVIVAVIVVRHLGSLQALRPATHSKRDQILCTGLYDMCFCNVMLCISSNNIDAAQISLFFPTLSPGVDLPVEVVEALVELLDVRLLPVDVGAVLSALGGQVVTAAFGQTQVLLRLSDI